MRGDGKERDKGGEKGKGEVDGKEMEKRVGEMRVGRWRECVMEEE